MKATCALGPATRWPSTKAAPSLGATSPEPMLRSVLLPQPVGPISDTTSASRTEKLTPRTAVSAPPPLASAKRIVTLRYSRRTTAISDHREGARRLCDGMIVFSLEQLNYTVKLLDREGNDQCTLALAYLQSAARFGLPPPCCSVRSSQIGRRRRARTRRSLIYSRRRRSCRRSVRFSSPKARAISHKPAST